MSDLLNLATNLKARDDQNLVELLERRGLTGAPKDFFDLAQSLLSARSIMSTLSTLTVGEAHLLNQMMNESAIDDSEIDGEINQYLQALADRALFVWTDTGPKALTAVIELAEPLLKNLGEAISPSRPKFRFDYAVKEETDLGLAAIAAFETQQGLYELLLDAEQHQIKHTGKTGFGVGDVKRVAGHLNLDNGQVRALYRLAARLNLLQLIGKNWWFTPAARNYVASTILDRWRILANQWLVSLGPLGSSALAQEIHVHPVETLAEALLRVFPLRDDLLEEQIEDLASQADALGLTIAGSPSPLLLLSLEGGVDLACDMLQRHLPGLQHNLIVQADLSLIAPGPLDAATEGTLRLFATVEQVSVANTYRLSAQSISHGMESGLSIDSIRGALMELYARPLPQPVEYLLTDTAAKFAKLRISAGPGGGEKSVITASDALLLTQVLNDSRLRAFAFKAPTASSIATRFEPDVVYQALREQGYLPVVTDSNGSIVPPRRIIALSGGLADSTANPLQLLVQNLREADRRVGSQPDDQDITRQIQLAIKGKVTLLIYATDRAGNEVEFTILPTAVANGRLRGMDRRSDVERTLPLERIVRVELG